MVYRTGRSPVYPRWRGEHSNEEYVTLQARGLSPLARGTHISCTPPYGYLRFIPAGAGNTEIASMRTRMSSVYPRWRGEHPQTCQPATWPRGLSPLARGTRSVPASVATGWRFIPAGAGNTDSAATTATTSSVYPRWRGEHCISFLII